MRTIIATAVLGLLSAPFLAHAGHLNDETDRFTGMRSVSWATLPSASEEFVLKSSAYIAESGNAYYQIQLITYADSSRYQDCRWVDWLVDGRRAPELKAEYDVDHGSGVSIERFTVKADRNTLESLASAKTVEYKVCNDEGVVRDEELHGLREVLAATKTK
ncbi:hypothetical protein NJF54_19950 [Pseudomonas guariconensis]|uniref:hypothetical protein n=1 Tax=Pseudomonas guariconensis TaxID=1288410 RepID=UPI00209A6D8C|nr:hypothetical protein [Pseudomonas guariconensis]MCO7634098.1 hypothetical protein [Pseudomonas guariconensis]